MKGTLFVTQRLNGKEQKPGKYHVAEPYATLIPIEE